MCYVITVNLGLTTAPLYSGTPFTIFIFWTLGGEGGERRERGGRERGREEEMGRREGGEGKEERRGRGEKGRRLGREWEEALYLGYTHSIAIPGFGNVHRH